MDKIVRTEKEIEAQIQKAEDASNDGSMYPGMSYEEGMLAMYQWLTGEVEDKPLELE